MTFTRPLTDIVGFKRPFMALTLMQSVVMLCYARLAQNRVTFAVATVLMLFGMGGNFAMFPAQVYLLWLYYAHCGFSLLWLCYACYGCILTIQDSPRRRCASSN